MRFPITYLAIFALFVQTAFTQEDTVSSTSENSTNGTTIVSCPEHCTFPPNAGGRGKAPFRMWYFDVSAQDCKTFRFTGRNGNKNRFWTRAICESNCLQCTTTSDSDETNNSNDVCTLPLSKGAPCPNSPNDVNVKWRFDAVTGACEPFAYLGCDGNENNFDTKTACEISCGTTD